MRISRKIQKVHRTSRAGLRVRPDIYVLCEKRTGVAHFRVEAGPNRRFPMDQAAGLLAMHCLVRGQSPRDYVVMVEAGQKLWSGLAARAEKLLQAGQAVRAPVQLSRREEEVLGGVMQSLANKEIAAALHLSERTVKFHVSSLLAKFRVRRRMELVREASRSLLPVRVQPLPQPVQLPVVNREFRPCAPYGNGNLRPSRAGDVLALPRRRLTA